MIPMNKTRDIGIIAHIDAGKTTTTERMLFFSGKTKRIGNVDQGDTVTDYLESERERGITIQLAAITIPWNGNKINIIDTPGHADFTFEVIRSLRVLDGAVTVLDAVEGVEAQTEKVWKQAQELELPKIAFINKMDRDGAGFSRTVKDVIEKLHTRVALCTLPYFETADGNPQFKGVIDVLNKKLLIWDMESDANGRKIIVSDPAEHPEVLETIKKSRASLIETLGELDEDIVDAFLENDEDCMEIPTALIIKAIRSACISNELTPIFCGSAFKNIGVQPLMDGITNFLPAPSEAHIPEITSVKKAKKKLKKIKTGDTNQQVELPVTMDPSKGLLINKDPSLTVALAFKVVTDSIRGPMTFFRVYSGKLNSNSTFINTRTGEKHPTKSLLLLHGDEPEQVKFISAGNIGVIAGNEEIITGDTLVSRSTGSKSFTDVEKNLKLNPIIIPPPLFNSSIEPIKAGDERYMNECIKSLVREDPSLTVHQDEELGQTILGGMGELHLEIIRERLLNDMKAKVNFREVAVSYKETLAKPKYDNIRLLDEDLGVGVEISLDSFEGNASESAFAEEEGAEVMDQDNNIIIFENDSTPQYMTDAIINRRWRSEFSMDDLQDSIVHGLQIGLQMGGPVLGFSLHSMVVRIKKWDFPVEDKTVSVTKLLDISRKVLLKSIQSLEADDFTLLEPVMETKVYVTSDYLGDITQDLTQRCQARISGIEEEGNDNTDTITWALEEAKKVYLPADYTMGSGESAADIRNKHVVVAETPLREMIGYLSKLRAMTRGRSTFDMTYLGMRRTIKSRMTTIIKEYS